MTHRLVYKEIIRFGGRGITFNSNYGFVMVFRFVSRWLIVVKEIKLSLGTLKFVDQRW